MHIIPRESVKVIAVTRDQHNAPISATYRQAETYGFQDEVGGFVARVVESVPHGVLCFFPSYGMMEKMRRRWGVTGVWQRMQSVKQVVVGMGRKLMGGGEGGGRGGEDDGSSSML